MTLPIPILGLGGAHFTWGWVFFVPSPVHGGGDGLKAVLAAEEVL